jgi:hypothetical protein
VEHEKADRPKTWAVESRITSFKIIVEAVRVGVEADWSTVIWMGPISAFA